MSKHTPGPWTATADPYSDVVVDASGREIAVVMDPNGEANSRLMASAPDLLEALVLLLPFAIDGLDDRGCNVDEDEYILFARAAIAKATGGEA
jgi:hypothetical protein